MRITSAEPSPKHKGMLRIHIDDSYAFTMPESAWLRLDLYDRESLSEEEVGTLRHTVLRQAVREQAVRFLSIKDRTEEGLRERLERAGFDPEDAAAGVADMKTLGYVNDYRFAQRHIAEQMRAKAVSRKHIRLDLRARGIADEVITEVLAEFEQDDEEIALRGARKKFGKYDLNDPAVERKAVSFLMHRGFGYDTVRTILRRLREETE